jgi:PiT family inorganic phosphate transporter
MAGKSALDKDLKKYSRLVNARYQVGRESFNLGLGVLFLLCVLAFAVIQAGTFEGNALIIVATVIGGYMALNIGANDVANNVGAAVGSGALTLLGALLIAVVFEAAGAIIAGGDVVKTISKGIIDPTAIPSAEVFVWAMMAALLAAAVWINLATFLGAPVSTTHSIVGGVMGAGIAAAGLSAVDWGKMTEIAASWVISPVLGGLIAAGFLAAIKYLVIFKEDKVAAAQRWVPVFVAVMAAAFAMYLMIKGLKRIITVDMTTVAIVGLIAFVAGYLVVRYFVNRAAVGMENRRRSVSNLFTIPLIFAAALLSFAHGANDVANAIGPLAAIVSTLSSGEIAASASVPFWIMAVGAIGIAAGLGLYGPKLIRVVGEKITKLDRSRAFCVALSAAITVLIASALGLPVSSTHIALGAIFGVGFLREIVVHNRRRSFSTTPLPAGPDGPAAAAPARELARPSARVSPTGLGPEADGLTEAAQAGIVLTNSELKTLKKARKRKLVRRRYVFAIAAAWVITVPAAALLAALFFFTLRGMLLA